MLKNAFKKKDYKWPTDMKRCSTLLITREMEIKTTKRYHFTPLRMAIIKKTRKNKCWQGCGERGIIVHCW